MDELNKPLGLRPDRRPLERRPAIYVAAAIFLILGATFAALLTVSVTPTPSATATIEPSSSPHVQDARAFDKDEGPATLTEVGAGFSEIEASGPLTDGGRLIIHDGSSAGAMRLSSFPLPDLVENSETGPLPRIGEDGTRPLDAYARPDLADRNAAGRIVIIIGGIGVDAESTATALSKLPSEVTLAFAPYGENIQNDLKAARDKGHELLLQLPMEPFNYPRTNPGQNTLTTDVSVAKNRERLHWLLSRMTNYVGVMNYMGARFSGEERAIGPVVREIGERGLMYVDDGSFALSRAESAAGTNTPFARADIILDADLSPASIENQLRRLTALARERGLAIATATAFPVTIEHVSTYVRQARDRGLAVVPVSALTRPHT